MANLTPNGWDTDDNITAGEQARWARDANGNLCMVDPDNEQQAAYVAQLAADAKTKSAVYFGLTPSATQDHTALLKSALQAATAEGWAIQFDAGQYNYTGLIDNIGCSIYGVKGLTKFVSQSADGRNTRWDFPNVNNINIAGITWQIPNKPASPSNNGTEPDSIIRVQVGKNVHIWDCEFLDPYGTAILLRSVEYGSIKNCRSIGGWKDSFHVTGLSKRITRAFCDVINGGDDAFPVVGYMSTGTVGQPEDIIDAFCRVRGLKSARGFAYVGAKNVHNYGCSVDGRIPAEYSPSSAFSTKAGLYVASEAGFDSYGNEDIYIDGMTVVNCGDSQYASAHITSRAGVTTKNINIRNSRFEKSAKQGIYCNGGVSGGISGLTMENVRIYDTTDANGVTGTAGAGSYNGFEAVFTANIKGRNIRIEETGGYALNIGTNCSESFDVEVTTANINKSGSAGVDIAFFGPNTSIRELRLELNVESQPQINSAGTPYFLDRIVECSSNASRIRKMQVNSPTGLLKSIAMATSAQTILVGASPFAFTNSQPYPVMVQVNGGTGITTTRAVTSGISSPVYGNPNTSKVAGYYTLMPGETLNVVYSTAPTMSWLPTFE